MSFDVAAIDAPPVTKLAAMVTVLPAAPLTLFRLTIAKGAVVGEGVAVGATTVIEPPLPVARKS